MEGFVVKAMQNKLGEWGVWWGVDGKATKLGYRRFFKTEQVAQNWVNKLTRKLLNK